MCTTTVVSCHFYQHLWCIGVCCPQSAFESTHSFFLYNSMNFKDENHSQLLWRFIIHNFYKNRHASQVAFIFFTLSLFSLGINKYKFKIRVIQNCSLLFGRSSVFCLATLVPQNNAKSVVENNADLL